MRVPLTIQQLMDNTAKKMGDKFIHYDALLNNCQSFLVGVLEGNGLMTPEYKSFILQDISKLREELPAHVGVVAKAATTAGAIADTILNGNGLLRDDLMRNVVRRAMDEGILSRSGLRSGANSRWFGGTGRLPRELAK
jgi:hypothetical protein